MDPKELEQFRNFLSTEWPRFKEEYARHQHNDVDGTNTLRKTITLDLDQFLSVGYGSHGSARDPDGIGTVADQIQVAWVSGPDIGVTGFVNKFYNSQVNILHQPNNTLNQSFVTGVRGPGVNTFDGDSVSTTAGGSTTTITGFDFETNELAGAVIDIYNSAGTLVESQIVSSNTATVVTIVGTWLNTTSGGSAFIYNPLFMGSADTIWQRFYAQEGTSGGIRFGIGVTNGGQNGLLYMDSAGDLFWRDKGGTSQQLNISEYPGASGTFTTADAKTVTVTNGIVTSIV